MSHESNRNAAGYVSGGVAVFWGRALPYRVRPAPDKNRDGQGHALDRARLKQVTRAASAAAHDDDSNLDALDVVARAAHTVQVVQSEEE